MGEERKHFVYVCIPYIIIIYFFFLFFFVRYCLVSSCGFMYSVAQRLSDMGSLFLSREIHIHYFVL